MSELVGVTLMDRYFLRQIVGSGGMADVYLAWDRLRSTKMAIKVLRRDLAGNPRFLHLFAKEAGVLRKLEHPNIVRLYEFDTQENIAFIVMDWIDGSNLRQAIAERQRPFSLDEIAYILQPVCSALNYAHQSNIFHCDVKPANILLHNDGRVLLSDFGVARLATENIGGGTPPYMAPEQFGGGQVSARSDIYALGITLYEMLSGGHLPYRGDSAPSQGSTTRERIAWEHIYLPLPSLQQYNPALPESITLFLSTALNKEPHLRFESTLAMRDAFESARAQAGRSSGGSQTIIDLFIRMPPPPQSKPASQPPPPARAQRQTPAARNEPRQIPPGAGQPRKPIPSKGDQPPKPPAATRTTRGKISTAAYLLGRSGDYSQQMIAISAQGLSIGRSSSCQVRISEGSVSRLHATLLVTRQGIVLRDENSALGTYVNNQRITSPILLKHGDVIRIGYYQIFEFRER